MADGPNLAPRPPYARFLWMLLTLLLVEAVLGAATSMWVTVPSNQHGSGLWVWIFSSSPLLAVHIVFAVLIFGTMAAVLVPAVREKDPRPARVAGVGMLGVVLAIVGGGLFVFYQPTDANVLLMVVGFFVAFLSGLGMIFLSRAARKRPPREPARPGSTRPTP